jgi:hypothetical protein
MTRAFCAYSSSREVGQNYSDSLFGDTSKMEQAGAVNVA